MANKTAARSGARVARQNLYTLNWGDFDVVYAYLSPAPMADVDDIGYWAITPQDLVDQVLYAIDQPWGVSISDVTVRASGEEFQAVQAVKGTLKGIREHLGSRQTDPQTREGPGPQADRQGVEVTHGQSGVHEQFADVRHESASVSYFRVGRQADHRAVIAHKGENGHGRGRVQGEEVHGATNSWSDPVAAS